MDHRRPGGGLSRPIVDAVSGDWRITPDDWADAIAATDGPQLVVAGPGTGKTEFLVRRATHLISAHGIHPNHLLVLTFSRRGASDLRRRIAGAIGRSHVPVQASTFHSFAARLLEVHGSVLGWDRLPTLLTGPEQVELVAELLRGEDPEVWPSPFEHVLSSRTFASDVADFLLRCAERLLDPDRLADLAVHRSDWRALPGFYRRYLEALTERGRIDYGNLLLSAVAALSNDEVAAETAEQFRYVIVDEYQDTSPAQVRLVENLTARHLNLTVAADPYQSIYSFRGADLESVADFVERFTAPDGPPARRIVLDRSFRVPAAILDAALRVTAGGSLPGSAGPVIPAAHRGSVEAYVFDQESAEAEWIATEVERMHLADQIPYRAMAVLVRSKRHLLPELSRALHRRGIPHDTPDMRLVDHPAVQTVFDVARATALHALDDPLAGEELDLAIRRLLLGPLFRLSVSAERHLVRERRRSGSSWADMALTIPDAGPLASLLADGAWATQSPAVAGFWHLWETLPQFAGLVHDPARADWRAAWAAFAQALDRQSLRDPDVTLIEYWAMSASDDFEATPLLRFDDRAADRLVLTTLHQAKGLEFDTVFIADATEGTFPDLRRGVSLLQSHSLTPDRAQDAAGFLRFRLQEEMRLAYTAMTRARSRVVWTATGAGIDDDERRPSRFLVPVAGVTGIDDLGPPRSADGPPLTPRQVQTRLRRVLVDPTRPLPDRLAAAAVLADPPIVHWDARSFAGVEEPGPDTGVVTAPFRLSPSQAAAYAECPRRYALEHRIRVSDRTTASAAFGTLVHSTLERADRAAMGRGDDHPRLEDALEALGRVWAEDADFGSPSLNAVWRTKAESLLERLFSEWPADSGRAIDVERALSLVIEDIEWVGRADRIESTREGVLRVVDYKTSATPLSVKEAEGAVQLGFYLLAASEDPDITAHGDVASAEFWYPRTSYKGFRRSFDPGRLGEVRDQLVEIGRGIAAEAWEARVGTWCRWCTVRGVCPRWPEGREGFVP